MTPPSLANDLMYILRYHCVGQLLVLRTMEDGYV